MSRSWHGKSRPQRRSRLGLRGLARSITVAHGPAGGGPGEAGPRSVAEYKGAAGGRWPGGGPPAPLGGPGAGDGATAPAEVVRRDRAEVAAVALPRRAGDLVDRGDLALDSRLGPIAAAALLGRAFCCSRNRGTDRNCSRIAEDRDGERGDEESTGRTHPPRFPAEPCRTCLPYLGAARPH